MGATASYVSEPVPVAVRQGSELRGLIDLAIQIAAKRRDLIAAMAAALRIHDNNTVVELAKQLCGIADEEGNRVNTRIN